MPSTSELQHREYWRLGETARVLGRTARYWAQRFEAGDVQGYRSETGQRWINADSAREYLRGLCESRPVDTKRKAAEALKAWRAMQ